MSARYSNGATGTNDGSADFAGVSGFAAGLSAGGVSALRAATGAGIDVPRWLVSCATAAFAAGGVAACVAEPFGVAVVGAACDGVTAACVIGGVAGVVTAGVALIAAVAGRVRGVGVI